VVNLFDVNRADEKKILENINRVVQVLIELSYCQGAKKNTLYADAVKLLQEMRPNLLGLVDGREELLESLTKQLISQKLPHPFIFNNLGDLQRDLNHILELSISTVAENDNVINYIEKQEIVQPEEDIIEEEKNTICACPHAALLEQIEKMLHRAYADEAICKNYLFRSLQIDYFVPAKKFGVIVKTSPLCRHKLYDYLLKKEGIRLLEISPAANDDVGALARQLPR
jgi:hypothetical protein